MITVRRDFGLRFVIFVDDHEPAHVHVFGDGEMKINLVGSDGAPEIETYVGMKRGDVRHALQAVIAQQQNLLLRWKEIHGGSN